MVYIYPDLENFSVKEVYYHKIRENFMFGYFYSF